MTPSERLSELDKIDLRYKGGDDDCNDLFREAIQIARTAIAELKNKNRIFEVMDDVTLRGAYLKGIKDAGGVYFASPNQKDAVGRRPEPDRYWKILPEPATSLSACAELLDEMAEAGLSVEIEMFGVTPKDSGQATVWISNYDIYTLAKGQKQSLNLSRAVSEAYCTWKEQLNTQTQS